MKKRDYTFYLNIIGIFLIIAPYIFTLFLSIHYSLSEQALLIDYLMPGELAFIVMPGALMILLASFKNTIFFKSKAILFIITLISILIVMILPGLIGFGHDPSLAHGFWYVLTFIALGTYQVSSLTLAIFTLIKL